MTDNNFESFDSILDSDVLNSVKNDVTPNETDDGGGYKDDEDVYFPASGKNGEKNTIKLRCIPSKHKSPFAGLDRLWILLKDVHKLRAGTEKLSFNCLKMQNYLNYKKQDGNSRYYDIPEGSSYYDCPCCKENTFPVGADKESPEKKAWNAKKAKVSGWINVYIEQDALYPENVGKVKKMYFDGRLWFKFINPFMKDTLDKEGNIVKKGNNPFDLQNGSPLWIEVEKVGEWDQFNGTQFLFPETFLSNKIPDETKRREEWKNIFDQTHDLSEKVGEFLTPEDLQEKLDVFYGRKQTSATTENTPQQTAPAPQPAPENTPQQTAPAQPVQQQQASVPQQTTPAPQPTQPIIEEDIDFNLDDVLNG